MKGLSGMVQRMVGIKFSQSNVEEKQLRNWKFITQKLQGEKS